MKFKTKDDDYIKMLHINFEPEIESLNLLTFFPHFQIDKKDNSDSTSSLQIKSEEPKQNQLLSQSYKEILLKFMKSLRRGNQIKYVTEKHQSSSKNLKRINLRHIKSN